MIRDTDADLTVEEAEALLDHIQAFPFHIQKKWATKMCARGPINEAIP